jgi:iron complex transport system substrate-binding protein
MVRRLARAWQRLQRVLWLLPISACGLAHGEYAVVDDTGRSVRLAEPARRIVALAPHLTELLFAAGAGAAIVGAAAYSDYPPAARAIPRVGDARSLDLERIVASRPDLIVAWASGSPRRQLDRLEALGYRVFRHEAASLDAIGSGIERLGVLAGTTAQAAAHARAYRSALAQLRADYAGAAPVRVFYQVNERPLLTVTRRHVIADALQLCGAVNVFADHAGWLPRPSREAVLLAQPDAIVVAGATGADRSALAPWQRWGSLAAVRDHALVLVDPDLLHRATPRIVTGVDRLCRDIAAVRDRRGGG